jgi:hypothetical protein
MIHTVKLHGVILGHSDLEEADVVLGRVWGKFLPAEGYDLVRPVFQLLAEAVPMRGGEPRDREKLARFHAARDKLGLVLTYGSGEVIPTNTIHISDYPGALELDVLISDETYWAERI